MTFGSAITHNTSLSIGCPDGSDGFGREVALNKGTGYATPYPNPYDVPESAKSAMGGGVGPIGWWALAGYAGSGPVQIGVKNGYLWVPRTQPAGSNTSQQRAVMLHPFPDWSPPFEVDFDVKFSGGMSSSATALIQLEWLINWYDYQLPSDGSWGFWVSTGGNGTYLTLNAEVMDYDANTLAYKGYTYATPSGCANITWRVRLRAEEDRILAKVWRSSDPEPSWWHLVVPLSGTQGNWSVQHPNEAPIFYVALRSSDTAETQLHRLRVMCDAADGGEWVEAATVIDTFDDRTIVSGGFGTATCGYIWDNVGTTNATVSVGNGVGKFTTATANGNSEQAIAGAGPWSIGQDFRLTARARVSGTAPTSGTAKRFVFGLGAPSEIVNCAVWWSIGNTMMLAVNGSTTAQKTGMGFTASAMMTLVWEHCPQRGFSRAKIWRDGEPEPTEWDVYRDTTGDTYPGQTDELSLWISNGTNATTYTVEMDQIDVTALPL